MSLSATVTQPLLPEQAEQRALSNAIVASRIGSLMFVCGLSYLKTPLAKVNCCGVVVVLISKALRLMQGV